MNTRPRSLSMDLVVKNSENQGTISHQRRMVAKTELNRKGSISAFAYEEQSRLKGEERVVTIGLSVGDIVAFTCGLGGQTLKPEPGIAGVGCVCMCV